MDVSDGQRVGPVSASLSSSPPGIGLASSRSSASSTLCSPASSTSRKQLSSAHSSPPVEIAVTCPRAFHTSKAEASFELPYGTLDPIANVSRLPDTPHCQRSRPSSVSVRSQPRSKMSIASTTKFAAFADTEPYPTGADRSASSSGAGTSTITERHASKSRRMSAGGSRHASEGIVEEGRNGFSRSESGSGSDWLHVQKTRTVASSGGNTDGRDEAVLQVEDTALDGMGQRVKPHLDLANFPPQELLRILAALLTQIATANDQLRPIGSGDAGLSGEEGRGRRSAANTELAMASSTHLEPTMNRGMEAMHDRVESHDRARGYRSQPTTASLGALHIPSSTLCFRARNIPSISIEAYLLRILRYCPASCEVFVSILVYFDRMSKMGQATEHGGRMRRSRHSDNEEGGEAMSRSDSGSASSIKDSHGSLVEDLNGGAPDAEEAFIGMRGFAIDSFNVHRLVIAGVTVASKFFSDVFYTNSRYAKVGGLPVHELNQLELQFLLLNDFKLMIPLDEMQRYADQLLVYGGSAADGEGRSAALPSRANTQIQTAEDSNGHRAEPHRADQRDHTSSGRDVHGDTRMANT